ncbi:hypothetical protein Trydic_g15168 [Trypoxylus dichotomus]
MRCLAVFFHASHAGWKKVVDIGKEVLGLVRKAKGGTMIPPYDISGINQGSRWQRRNPEVDLSSIGIIAEYLLATRHYLSHKIRISHDYQTCKLTKRIGLA